MPWTVVCRGVIDGIAAVIHRTRTPEGTRRVAEMVRVCDYDAHENRWRVELIWPAPATPDTGEIDSLPATSSPDQEGVGTSDGHAQTQEEQPCTHETRRT